MTGHEIREKFLTFFEGRGHTRVASSLLIPSNDPTLFFTNAGMVPFKDVFTGLEKRSYVRATSSQKCLRVSGKHNDLENVGRSPRHHTFFEMLGNFSFGDYFKEEAIAFAWEFLTKIVGLPDNVLWATVFKDDDEAEKVWLKKIGIPKGKMIRCNEKDNFWSMGETGPCGPCSEIHIDLKKWHGEGKANGNPATNEADFMEVWNLVFMQFDRDAQGKLTPLPKPSIDTGMGLERLAAILQKKKSNYDTDLFMPLISYIAKRVGKPYGHDPEIDVSIRVLADHIRSTTFLMNDGVKPSNEGRGYVLRRILRRAIRHGRLLEMHQPFFYELVSVLVDGMQSVYADLKKNEHFIVRWVKAEEEKFLETLENGLAMIQKEINHVKANNQKVLSGTVAFKLYDTFGFPVDLTQLIACEKGLSVAMNEFEHGMEAQKTRARAAWKGSGQEKISELYHQLAQEKEIAKFVGYETLAADSVITSLIVNGNLVDQAKEGDEVEVFVDKTPFYGESGGQVGDQGCIESKEASIEIGDTQKPLEGIISHRGKIFKGSIKVGDPVHLMVLDAHRRPTMLNHTATHILHAALREVLGDHVKQAGSLVEPSRLRFDFNHFQALTSEEIQKIEKRVNEVIQANYPVTKQEMSFAEAQKKGALAFFGDKYGERVRVVSIGLYSMEFCGGTHLNASGEIGFFKIVSETSVASGVRRIEGLTGMGALSYVCNIEKKQKQVAELLKAVFDEVPQKIKSLIDRVKELEKENLCLKSKLALGGSGADPLGQVQMIRGIRLLTLETEVDDPKALREFSDQLKNRLGSGILVLGSKANGKVSLLVTVSKDLADQYHAGKIISELAAVVGGKGGGRPDMAQAGGTQPEKLADVFLKAKELL